MLLMQGFSFRSVVDARQRSAGRSCAAVVAVVVAVAD